MSLPNITREICNAWKCDRTIASLMLSAHLGKIASLLGRWNGARIGQDDLWMKPPSGGKEIAYHTDAAYIPWPMVTCWIALTEVSSQNGTLEYIQGSHKWTKYKSLLDTSGFHAPKKDYTFDVKLAAKAEGISEEELKRRTVKVEVPIGGCSFHHGETWHGSGPNRSQKWRNNIAAHFISEDSSFAGKGNVGYIYGRYKIVGSDKMEESFFPIVWRKDSYRTPFLADYCKDLLLD